MRARLQRRDRSIGVALVINGKKNGRYVSQYLGWLGEVFLPASPEDHATFWAKLNQRLKDIAARDPRVTPEEIEKVKTSIKARLPAPAKASARSFETEERQSVRVTT